MSNTARADHLAWCKRRALAYVEAGDLTEALASMMSDLRKHPETEQSGNGLLVMLGLEETKRGKDAMRDFINGFN